MIRFPVKRRSNHMLKSASLLSRSLSSGGRSSHFQKRTKDGRGLSSYPAMVLEEDVDDRKGVRSALSQSNASPLLSVSLSGKKDANSIENFRKVTQIELEKKQAYLSYISEMKFPITSKLQIVDPDEDTPKGIWPVFRLMDEEGDFLESSDDTSVDKLDRLKQSETKLDEYNSASVDSKESEQKYDLDDLKQLILSKNPFHDQVLQKSDLLCHSKTKFYDMPTHMNTNTLLRAHRQMIRLRAMDYILLNAQRQGRISFYMTCSGEEAIHVGSASALKSQDVVLAQYREAGILMWRGFTLEQFTNQCFSNDLDVGRGRQMPVHYGSRALNYHTISSPLGTQLPQAVGVAYRKKLDVLEGTAEDPGIAVVYFGEGAASTGDFHSACNFAATLKTPMIFFCRNNGYAISTPVQDQYSGDGIVSRAPGYGMAAIRVDGNDVFAVNAVVKAAREYAIQNSVPVFIEAITYRQGHHSTSDDASQYRDVDEVSKSRDQFDPLLRLNSFLQKHNWLEENEVSRMENEERRNVVAAMELAERRPKPKLNTMFEDVYHKIPAHLKIQEKSLNEHIQKYPDKYE